MVFFAREEEDDDSIGSISSDSSATPPNLDENEEVQKETDPRQDPLDISIKEAQEQLKEAKAENATLHGRILATRQRMRSIVDADMLEGQDFLYQSNLTRWVELKDELDQLKQKYRLDIDEMHDRLQMIQVQAHEQYKSLIRDLWQVAKDAQNTVTGQILSDVVLNQLEERDRAATAEASKVRIQARQLRSQLAKLESAKRKKDQLPGGLHLVDFEQLKMETESLAEKISVKNEEIGELRKKRTTAVHSLSHVREKLQHVEKDTKIAKDKLDTVEKDLHHGRIELCNLKARCEQILRKKGNMQKSMVNISDPLLLDDLENLKEDGEATEEILTELRTRFKSLNDENRKFSPLRTPKDDKASADSTEISSKHDLRWGKSMERMWRQRVC